uniref:Putative secreted protein n=1 Tax=Ixodes scapularis TaxID=6945 RepID=A0A4D5RXH1_IXOSC
MAPHMYVCQRPILVIYLRLFMQMRQARAAHAPTFSAFFLGLGNLAKGLLRFCTPTFATFSSFVMLKGCLCHSHASSATSEMPHAPLAGADAGHM